MVDVSDKVTVLVPTKNRSDFVLRLLHYYRSLKFRGSILVGDSSDPEHRKEVERAISLAKRELRVSYSEHPPSNNAECVRSLLQVVSTPYVALLPDDDFLVPASLYRCAEFLDRAPEYSAAHGVAVLFTLDRAGPYGRVKGVSQYWQRPIEQDTAEHRLLDHLDHYSVTLFSVHRTNQMRLMYQNTNALRDKTFVAEIVPCCLSVILGKVKELDCLYLVRQVHAQRYLLPDLFDWLTSPDWFQSYEIFRDCLSEALAQQDDIGTDKARKVVKQAFWLYLAKGLNHKWQARYRKEENGTRSYWREVARRVPGLLRVGHKLRSAISSQGSEMSLPALLYPSSSYHADFMPIYRVVNVAGTNLSGERD